MAKVPNKKVPVNSNKSETGATGKASAKRKRPAKRRALLGDPDPCQECNPCAGLETGVTGVVWCDGAGQLQVLPFAGGDKVLGWDSNGPYWRNLDSTPGGA